MSKDKRDILEVLQSELDFIEHGGYSRSMRIPWRAKSAFQDSRTCLDYGNLKKVRPCSECQLIDFVPSDKHSEQAPCHFIPLDESGWTIDELESENDQHQLERVLKTWLRAKITVIKATRPPAVSYVRVSLL